MVNARDSFSPPTKGMGESLPVTSPNRCYKARQTRPQEAVPVAVHAHLHPSCIPHVHYSFPPGLAAGSASGGVNHAVPVFNFGPGFEPQPPQRFAASVSGQSGSNLGQEHVVYFHVNPGVTVTFQMGDNRELIRGPVTVPMVSTNSSPPIAMPVQVPPGHVVQQIVDENGTLRHVILSAQHPGHPGHMHHHMSHQHHGGPPHQHPGHFIPGNSSSQPFFPPGAISPHGYHPPHYHPSHIQPPGHMGGHVGPLPGNQTSHGQHSPHSTHSNHSNQSNHSNHSPLGPHSPPPPNHSVPPAGALGGYQHKDERTQRQFVKLKRKLEQKQMRGDGIGINSGQSTPGLSPRKELVNGLRRGAARGMSSVGTSDDGEESSSVQDDDDDTQMIELLSSVQCPQVTEVTSRSALLLWKEPSSVGELYEKHLSYDVLLSDKGKEGKYKTIYSGAALSCRIQDLRPGQEYAVCLQVRLDDIQGSATDPMVITTPACEPDAPQPPKLIGRTRTSLQLRWNAAVDNGSHIQHYLLEYDEGKGGEFVELSKGKGKQNSLSKLQPSTCFKFRLAAVNECGKSAYSDIVAFSTSGSPPAQPTPPMLKAASVTSLQLSWNKRPNDEDFTLQMDDHYSKHGFLTVFTGAENEYVCHNLRRNSNFRFRLKAHNEEGPSRWSDEVNFTTLPDRPAPPSKPYVKGKIHAHSFKVKWDPPCDQGGAPISAYVLEINTGSGFETVYSGHDTESVCDRLQPGTSYQLRVSCISAGGRSNNSDFGIITTEAVCPGPCAAPRPSGKPRATSAAITWTSPDYDGGAPVLEYEVELITDSERRQAFKGKETECTIQELLPGLNYGFTVRAVNRIGAGAWSEELYLTSGAAPPDTPPAPEIVIKSATNVFATWEEPNANGAPITEYRLETSSVDEEDRYNIIYQGSTNSYDFRNLIPFTTYYFRVAASNISGFSSLSPVSATVTPASTPAIMATPSFDVSPTQIELTWTEPCNHGAEIMFYNIEVVDKVYTTEGPVLEYVLDSLEPETVYRIKVQAVNSVGAGPFSSVLKVTTLPLPPAAPKLECIATGHNSLKLKWGDGKNSDFTQYCVEMYNQRAKEYQCVYQGTAFTCKVNKLQELSKYSFRICASNDIGGQGDFSDDVEFSTSTAPPSGLKAPKLIEVGLNSCLVEWTPCKATRDPISYAVQCCKARDQQYKEVYSGSDTKCTLEQLETGCEYHVRVLPIRLAPTGDLAGPPSPILSVSTLSLEPVVSPKTTTPNTPLKVRKHGSLSWFTPTLYTDRKPLTDQQWAVVIIVGFIIIAVSAAVIAEQFIKSA